MSQDRNETGVCEVCDVLYHLSGLLWLQGCATALRALQAFLPDVFTDQDKLCIQGCKAEQSFCNGSDKDMVLAVKEMGTSCLCFVSV